MFCPIGVKTHYPLRGYRQKERAKNALSFCLSNRNFLLLCPCKFNKEQGRSGAQTPAAEAAQSEAGIDLADAERRVYGACGFHTRFLPIKMSDFLHYSIRRGRCQRLRKLKRITYEKKERQDGQKEKKRRRTQAGR